MEHTSAGSPWRNRVLIAGLSVVVLVWVVPGWRQHRAIDGAVDLAVAGDLSGGRDRMTDARSLGPDERPRLREAQLLVLMKRPTEARDVLAPVLAAEPENLDAWLMMRVIAIALKDARLRTKTDRQLAVLDPRAARSISPPRSR